MENNKIQLIKKVLMLDTQKEIDSVLEFVSDAISRECEQDDLDQNHFAEWKKEREEENGQRKYNICNYLHKIRR